MGFIVNRNMDCYSQLSAISKARPFLLLWCPNNLKRNKNNILTVKLAEDKEFQNFILKFYNYGLTTIRQGINITLSDQ